MQLREFVWLLRSPLFVVFNHFLLKHATDKSKISTDRYQILFATDKSKISIDRYRILFATDKSKISIDRYRFLFATDKSKISIDRYPIRYHTLFHYFAITTFKRDMLIILSLKTNILK